MSITKNIRKILLVCISAIGGAGLIVLIIAAVNARNHKVCEGYEIEIKDNGHKTFFIDKKDVEKVLTANKTIVFKNQPMSSINLGLVESRIKKEPWVKDAQLFFDNSDVLKVIVEQRQPIARIFSSSGGSFYIDSSGKRMPLSDKIPAKLPVFTGYPIDSKKDRTPSDLKLIRDLKSLSIFLLNNPFWMAQISQIDITPSREFEMVPTVGNHIIEFGDGTDHEEKFRKLFVFYKQVLAKSGMDKYDRIKVQFDDEIIGVKK
ncbi:MAG: cell division protein FtsQ/DivIB [Chitinophagaceae bacterium]|nr:cell division protein FtsQ/DivIB [Chitinophagaceae bacterium]